MVKKLGPPQQATRERLTQQADAMASIRAARQDNHSLATRSGPISSSRATPHSAMVRASSAAR